MIIHKFEFNTYAEAEAFKDGVEFVNDSNISKIELEVPVSGWSTPDLWVVLVYDMSSESLVGDHNHLQVRVSGFAH